MEFKNFNEFKISLKYVIIFFVIVIIGFIFFTNAYTVDTGEVAIISRFGKILKIEQPGLHFKIPFIDTKTELEVREKIYDFTKKDQYGNDNSLNVSTKDIQTVNIELTVQAGISDPQKLYTAFKGFHEVRFIRPRVSEIVQATISKYTIEEFVSKRTEISNLIYQALKDDFDKYGLAVSNISIVNHDFSDDYERAIEKKKVAEQAVETARAEQEKLAVEAENKVKLAQYALKEKELQAKANKIVSESLTPQLLKKMTIEKWNGELPKVQGSANSIITPEILK